MVVFKFVLVGDSNAGKSALIKRYVVCIFSFSSISLSFIIVFRPLFVSSSLILSSSCLSTHHKLLILSSINVCFFFSVYICNFETFLHVLRSLILVNYLKKKKSNLLSKEGTFAPNSPRESGVKQV